jgi:hypothetical protein
VTEYQRSRRDAPSRPSGGATRDGGAWRVVETRRHKERAAQAALAQVAVPAYLPLLQQWPRPAGAEVVVTEGPLRGLVAVVERRLTARQRVLLLLEILQRQTRVEMPERWVRQA